MARTSVCKDLVVAGGEAFGGQVLHIPVHVFRCTSDSGAWCCRQIMLSAVLVFDC